MNKKIILIDAVYCLVDTNGKINSDLSVLLNKYDNRKIVLTNADDKEKSVFLRNISYETFSLKHKPDKVDSEYYRKFLESFSLNTEDLIYFEHDKQAVKSARSVGINTHYFDGNLVDTEIVESKMKDFLNQHEEIFANVINSFEQKITNY